MKFDNTFTERVQAWVNKDTHTTADALTGAQLLVQIAPKNVAYRRFLSLAVTRPSHILSKLEYELKTHLRYRLDGLTLEQVRRLDQRVVPEADGIIRQGEPSTASDEATEGNTLGRRADHDTLPEDIQKLWTDNAALYKDIKALFEELKSMEDLPSCQRYDQLQLLAAKDKRYLANMERYDGYVVEAAATSSSTATAETSGAAAASTHAGEATAIKTVANARAYLSKNIDKLSQLAQKASGADADSPESQAHATLAGKMQQRADVLLANGVMTDEMRQQLTSLGLTFETTDDGTTDTADAAAAS